MIWMLIGNSKAEMRETKLINIASREEWKAQFRDMYGNGTNKDNLSFTKG